MSHINYSGLFCWDVGLFCGNVGLCGSLKQTHDTYKYRYHVTGIFQWVVWHSFDIFPWGIWQGFSHSGYDRSFSGSGRRNLFSRLWLLFSCTVLRCTTCAPKCALNLWHDSSMRVMWLICVSHILMFTWVVCLTWLMSFVCLTYSCSHGLCVSHDSCHLCVSHDSC